MLWAATHDFDCVPLTKANWPAHMHPLNWMHSALPGSGYEVKKVRLALRQVRPPVDPPVPLEPPVPPPLLPPVPPVPPPETVLKVKRWLALAPQVFCWSLAPLAVLELMTSRHLPLLTAWSSNCPEVEVVSTFQRWLVWPLHDH